MTRRVCVKQTRQNRSGIFEDKRSTAVDYDNSKRRQVDNRQSMNHEKNESHVVCFGCGEPGHVIGKCTMGSKTQEE